jgi:hypothetical protein
MLKPEIVIALIAGMALTYGVPVQAATPDPEYILVITERSEKIVAPLGISDTATATRVRDLLVGQYQNLNQHHDGRSEALKELRESGDNDEATVQAFEDARSRELLALHREFVARLAAELTPEQVNQVKDGMTYGVVQVTYNAYRAMLPDLTEEQDRFIIANLLEARDYAMDAGSSGYKHKWFGKYKGRINNYLSAEGYDLKQAERDMRTRQQAQQE